MTETSSETSDETTSGVSGEETTQVTASASFELGNLIAPFDPPTLEDLDAQVEWEEGPVVDLLELLRKRQADEPKLATEAEALRLKNTSRANNKKIVGALGRLPANDGEVDYSAETVRHIRGDINHTNPIFVSSTQDFDVTNLAWIGLFVFDWELRPYANAETVEKWYRSKDGLYDKVILRDDWRWSDGTPVTAHDVEFTFRTIMTSEVDIPAVRNGTDEVKYVKAYDDRTVVFFHKEALATNVWNIFFLIIPKHVYEDTIAEDPTLKGPVHRDQLVKPVVNGPYEIERWNVKQSIQLRRRENYFMVDGKQVRYKPHFARVRFQVISNDASALLGLKRGDIESLELTPDQWANQTDDQEFYRRNVKASGVEWVAFSFFWNNRSKYFDDARTRKAMSYAFDHTEMLEVLRQGLDEPATGIFHPASPWASKPTLQPYEQDLEKAEELLEAAGWGDSDGDGYLDKRINGKLVPFEFDLMVSNQPWRIPICELLKESLDELGIVMQHPKAGGVALQVILRDHNFDAAFSGWGTGADPDTSSNIWDSKEWTRADGTSGRNYVGYSNPRVDELYEKGRREFDLQKRQEIYQEIHRLIWEDQPYTWLFYRNSLYAFNRDLRGFNFSPRGPFNYGPGFFSIWAPQN